MRKQILQFTLMLCCILAMPLATFGADSLTVDNLTYTTNDDGENTVSVTGYVNDPNGLLTIPSTVTYGEVTYTVTAIADGSSFTYGVFYECTELTSVTIPETLTSIGNYAFYGCSALESATIDYVTKIGISAFNSCSALTAIDIPAEVTTINDRAFYGCSALTAIDIPAGVTTIGNYAFISCTKLESVTFADDSQLATIGTNVFEYCSALTEIDIPAKVTEIGSSAFSNCSALTAIDIPAGVTTIGSYAFYNCTKLASVTFAEGSALETILSRAFRDCSALTEINIPASVSSIGAIAFYGCSKLASVTFAEGSQLTTIEANAFNGCSALSSIEIPEGVTLIDAYAFNGCSSIASVIVNSSTPATIAETTFSGISDSAILYVPEGSVEAYSSEDYYWSDFFASIVETLPLFTDLTYSYDDVNRTATITGYTTEPTGKISLPSTTEYDGKTYTVTATANGASSSLGAFYCCSDLTSVFIPKTITTLGDYTFYMCIELESISFANDSELKTIGTQALRSCVALTEIEIPASVTEISNYAFYNCTKLVSVTFADGSQLTTIGESALRSCVALTEIEIHAGVTTISNSMFTDCKLLVSVTFAEGSQLTTIEANAFNGCSALSSIEIPEGVTLIDAYAFNACTSLTSIEIPADVAKIDNYAFYDCSSIASVIVNSSTPAEIYSSTFSGISDSAVLYVPLGSKETYAAADYWNAFSTIEEFIPVYNDLTYSYDDTDMTATITGYTVAPTGAITLPSTTKYNGNTYTVTSIGIYAFKSSALTTIDIPAEVTSIGDYTFQDCTDLESVTFAEGSLLELIDWWAFYECSSLKSIDIPASVTEIDGGAFYGCSKLASVTFAEDSELTTIGANTFKGCEKLTEIVFPDKATTIGMFALDGCSSLESVTFAEDSELTTISQSLFSSCKSLTSIELPAGVTTINVNAFQYCDALESLVIPAGVTEINNYTFYYCKGLTSIELPAGLTSIGYEAFRGCEKLTAIDIPDGVTEIDTNTFYDCSELTSVTFGENSLLTSIGEDAFYECSSLTSIVIPANVTTIGNYAFYNCQKLVSVTVKNSAPSTISLGNNAFTGTSGSKVLYVPAGKVDAYSDYSSWTTYFKLITDGTDGVADGFTATEEVTVSGSYTFTGATKLTTMTIAEDAEVNAEDATSVTIDQLTIERTFEYESGKASNEQWFSLGLPFEGVASGTYVQKLVGEVYVAATCGVDYVTFNYNGERRATKEDDSTESNWDMLYSEGGALGELIQFATTGTHKYRFISPSATEATTALKTGRTGSTYYNEDSDDDDSDNGWNLVPAGKTYSTEKYDIFDGLASIQIYDGENDKFNLTATNGITAGNPLSPGTVFAVKLLKDTDEEPSTGSATTTSITVDCYTFELVDAEGEMLDRIYLFDGSNHLKYRLGKMSSLNSSVAQMAIKIDDKSYCTYGTLASEAKVYNVALTNTDGASLVMKSAGSQTVAVDGSALTVDTPISVEDGEIVITIGSAVTGVDSLTDESLVINGANGTISISGVEAGTTYAITAMSGITTYGTASGETTRIDKPAGIYIVKIGNTVTKVIVK